VIQVLIVEDDPMARQLLEIYVEKSGAYSLAQSVESAAFAELCCRARQIDLILMDVCTAMNVSGLEAAEKIKSRFPDTKIIIITSHPECSFLDRARAAGVESFWYKTASAEEILTVMDKTMAGERIYPDNTPSLKLHLACGFHIRAFALKYGGKPRFVLMRSPSAPVFSEEVQYASAGDFETHKRLLAGGWAGTGCRVSPAGEACIEYRRILESAAS
jgi:CheY-like chemotaxis protein